VSWNVARCLVDALHLGYVEGCHSAIHTSMYRIKLTPSLLSYIIRRSCQSPGTSLRATEYFASSLSKDHPKVFPLHPFAIQSYVSPRSMVQCRRDALSLTCSGCHVPETNVKRHPAFGDCGDHISRACEHDLCTREHGLGTRAISRSCWSSEFSLLVGF
jgi:hypothetical protein